MNCKLCGAEIEANTVRGIRNHLAQQHPVVFAAIVREYDADALKTQADHGHSLPDQRAA